MVTTGGDYVIVAFGAFMNLLYAATTDGWPSLEFILKQEHYFEISPRVPFACNGSFFITGEQFSEDRNVSTENKTDMSNCKDDSAMFQRMSQDAQLNLIFTVAGLFSGLSHVVNGYLFDRFGTYVVRFICR